MKYLLRFVLNVIAVLLAATLVPATKVETVWAAALFAIVLGLVNTLIKPILIFLTLPITLITLGLFYFVINGLMVILASLFVPGFQSGGFLTAILFSIVLSTINWFIDLIFKKEDK